ncbi:MAG: hypothetical protein ACAH88_08215 [Roseimicrobium sp.]
MPSITAILPSLWRSRWVRFIAYAGAALLAALVGLTIWMNHKGSRDWKEAQAMLASEGVELDFKAMKVASVADADNFCAIPLLKGVTAVEDGDETKGEPAVKRKAVAALGLPPFHSTYSRPPVSNTEAVGMPVDLREWSDWLRKIGHPMPVTDPDHAAREVLAALSYHDAAIAEMAAAVNRPVARFLPAWTDGPMPEPMAMRKIPHLSVLQNLSDGLSLRAKAAAQAGDVAKAHEAALILARLAEATCEEPCVIGLLVGTTRTSILSRTVWELGVAGSGTAEDFLRLQHALERLDIQGWTVRAFKEEIAVCVDGAFYMQRHRVTLLADVEGWSNWKWVSLLIPEGWFKANAASTANLTVDYIVRPLRDRGWPDALAAQHRLHEYLSRTRAEIWWHPDKMLTVLSVPAFLRIVERTAYAQGLVDQAIIACALERYRIEHGGYPDTLRDLSRPGEKPLPLDILSGAPFGYRKTEDGRYILWGVGYDGTDDGGQNNEGTTARSKPTHRDYQGDWVWSYPTREEIAASKAPKPAPPRPVKRSKAQKMLEKKAEPSTQKIEN